MAKTTHTVSDSARYRVGRLVDRSKPFPVDVEDRGEEYLVTADLPGLRKQNVDISVRRDRIWITADFGDDEGSYRRKERERGRVQRVIRLPEPIDEKRVSASYGDGVLSIALRKRSRPKRVEVE